MFKNISRLDFILYFSNLLTGWGMIVGFLSPTFGASVGLLLPFWWVSFLLVFVIAVWLVGRISNHYQMSDEQKKRFFALSIFTSIVSSLLSVGSLFLLTFLPHAPPFLFLAFGIAMLICLTAPFVHKIIPFWRRERAREEQRRQQEEAKLQEAIPLHVISARVENGLPSEYVGTFGALRDLGGKAEADGGNSQNTTRHLMQLVGEFTGAAPLSPASLQEKYVNFREERDKKLHALLVESCTGEKANNYGEKFSQEILKANEVLRNKHAESAVKRGKELMDFENTLEGEFKRDDDEFELNKMRRITLLRKHEIEKALEAKEVEKIQALLCVGRRLNSLLESHCKLESKRGEELRRIQSRHLGDLPDPRSKDDADFVFNELIDLLSRHASSRVLEALERSEACEGTSLHPLSMEHLASERQREDELKTLLNMHKAVVDSEEAEVAEHGARFKAYEGAKRALQKTLGPTHGDMLKKQKKQRAEYREQEDRASSAELNSHGKFSLPREERSDHSDLRTPLLPLYQDRGLSIN